MRPVLAALILWVCFLGGASAQGTEAHLSPYLRGDPHSWKTDERTARFNLGVAAYDKQQFEQAFLYWLPLARMGDLAAQRNVGHLLRLGLGVARDAERAVYFYRRAAENGLTGAQANLGMMLLAGDGVEQDEEEAARWLAVAARAGHTEAQFELGRMVEQGIGTAQNRELAIKLYRAAAKAGYGPALKRWQSLSGKPLDITPGQN